MPFATVSCGEARVEPTGAELVLRSSPEVHCEGPAEVCAVGGGGEPAFDDVDVGRIVVDSGGGLAAVALLAFAFALVWTRGARGFGWPALAGAVGVAALAFLGTRNHDAFGGGGVGVMTEPRAGFWLALGSGAAGTLVACFASLRAGLPNVRPLKATAGAGLLLVGYLLPSSTSEFATRAYADSLDLRHPWLAVSAALPPAVGLALLARRTAVRARLASFALGVLVPAGVATAQEIWTTWRHEVLHPGVSPFVFLAGIFTATVFAARHLHGQQREPGGVRVLLALLASAVLVAAAVGRPVDDSRVGTLAVRNFEDVAWALLAVALLAVAAVIRAPRGLERRAFLAGLAISAVATGLVGLFALTSQIPRDVDWAAWATLAAGALLLAACVPRRGRAGRPAAARARPARAQASPAPGPSVRGSGGNRPEAP